MKVVTVEEMRRIEAASDAAGHSYAAMMERAGRAVAEATLARHDTQDRHVLVLVGPGNNGGDGLVAARYLAAAGATVACYLLKPRDPVQDGNLAKAEEQGVQMALAGDDPEWHALRRLVQEADLILDALLGTGMRLPLQGAAAELLNQAGQAMVRRRKGRGRGLTGLTGAHLPADPPPFVVAVDGPSGLDFDSGDLSGVTLPADLTVTFAHPKLGHLRFPGAGAVGELVVADIGTDPALAADVQLEVANPDMVAGMLPMRPADAHKGTFGRALVVAGSVNYTGAAYLAGAAATRVGAGLVTIALPAAIHTAVAARLAEATYLLLPHELGAIAPAAAEVLADRLADYEALLLGPGLGREKATVAFVESLLGAPRPRRRIGFAESSANAGTRHSLPSLVVDADGLNILADTDDWPAMLPPGSVLTPHPGEMARLIGCTIEDVQRDRVGTARAQSAAWGHVVVLKGAHTVVASPDGRVVIEPFANAGLATAGTGDVLAGAIVGLKAQGLSMFDAAVAGAYLHGLAGEWARREIGVAGMVASDVLARLPQAIRRVAQARGG